MKKLLPILLIFYGCNKDTTTPMQSVVYPTIQVNKTYFGTYSIWGNKNGSFSYGVLYSDTGHLTIYSYQQSGQTTNGLIDYNFAVNQKTIPYPNSSTYINTSVFFENVYNQYNPFIPTSTTFENDTINIAMSVGNLIYYGEQNGENAENYEFTCK